MGVTPQRYRTSSRHSHRVAGPETPPGSLVPGKTSSSRTSRIPPPIPGLPHHRLGQTCPQNHLVQAPKNQHAARAGEDGRTGSPGGACGIGNWGSREGNSTDVPQNSKNRWASGRSSSTPGGLSEENKNTHSRKRCLHTCAHCSVTHNSQDVAAGRVPAADTWIEQTRTHARA